MKEKEKEKQAQAENTKTLDMIGEEKQTPAPVSAPVSVSDDQTTPDNYKIYENNIYSYIDEFIEGNYAGQTETELKENKAFFPLLVDYLYDNYIGDLLGNKGYKKVVYKDIDILDGLFNIYINLVYRYKWNNKPYIVEFSLFTGINKDTFYQWLNGDYSYIASNQADNALRDCITSRHTDAVRKWISACERALLDNNDTIKDIFILKAKHGYKDNNNDVTITVNHKAIISAENLPDLIGINGNN